MTIQYQGSGNYRFIFNAKRDFVLSEEEIHEMERTLDEQIEKFKKRRCDEDQMFQEE